MTGAEHTEPRRPFRQEVALSGLFTVALFLVGWAASFVGAAIAKSDRGALAFVALVYLVVVAFLVYYAYPPGRRRWAAWAGFELCVVIPAGIVIPVVYLPWLIVTRREWRRAARPLR